MNIFIYPKDHYCWLNILMLLLFYFVLLAYTLDYLFINKPTDDSNQLAKGRIYLEHFVSILAAH